MKKVLWFLFFFVFAMAFFSTTAFAYIDPSAMTYIIQLVAGMVIAVGAAFGFYARRIRRAFSRGKEKAYRDDHAAFADTTGEGFGDYPILPQDACWDAPDGMSGNALQGMPADEEVRQAIAAAWNLPAPAPLPAVTCDPCAEAPDALALADENTALRRALEQEQQNVTVLKKALQLCMAANRNP